MSGNRPTWAELIDLASARLGGKALACSDDFFAPMANLLRPEPPVFVPGKYTAKGKWMDGWESRRKRVQGHDWCIVALGRPGLPRGINVDTAHFNGNQPESCTLEGAEIVDAKRTGKGGTGSLPKTIAWIPIIERAPLKPSSEHFIPVVSEHSGRRITHVRLNIFPDGGVARLRVHGDVLPDWFALAKSKKPVDLAAAENGGLVIDASNMHFGSRHNMIMPGRAENMGDGWETRRRRALTWTDGRPVEHDWAIVRLGKRGIITSIDVDTNHFKGNFPESCTIEACDASGSGGYFDAGRVAWASVLARTKLRASAIHPFSRELDSGSTARPCTHIRIRIYPDGGISRMRVWGRPVL